MVLMREKGPARKRRMTKASVVFYFLLSHVLMLVKLLSLWCRLLKPIFWYFMSFGFAWYFYVWSLPLIHIALVSFLSVWLLVNPFLFCYCIGLKGLFSYSLLVEQPMVINDDKMLEGSMLKC
jgi:hypothetical protein